jgi:hypothetical protein
LEENDGHKEIHKKERGQHDKEEKVEHGPDVVVFNWTLVFVIRVNCRL